MEKILVTGGAGFIGRHLVNYLLQKKINVRILIREKNQKVLLSNGPEYFQGDLTKQSGLRSLCDNIDVVFHLAGYAHAASYRNVNFINHHTLVNTIGTKNLIEEAIKSKVKKFIFFSSIKAVSDSENCVDESWEKYPISPYGRAKREAEKIVLEARSYGMHVCILRPALVYGPGWKGNLATMLRMIDIGLFPRIPPVNNKRSMISVQDICRAALVVADHPKANGKVYFVTDNISYSTYQIYILIKKHLNHSPLNWHLPIWFFKFLSSCGDLAEKISNLNFPFNSESMIKLFGSAEYNSQLIQLELGFKPVYTFNDVLPQIISTYRQERNMEI